MNYKQKYEEAIERCKSWIRGEHPECFSEAQKAAEFIFPELRESEDERIRKGLIKGLSAMRDIHKHQTFSDDALNIDDAIAWLEKQGDQKPAWSEEDKEKLNSIIEILGDNSLLVQWLKSLKNRVQPKQEWSEEEIDLLLSNLDRNIKEFVTTDEFENEIGGHYWAIAKHAFLLGLGYNQNWKPSEEQINELITAMNNATSPEGAGILESLYNEIIKL